MSKKKSGISRLLNKFSSHLSCTFFCQKQYKDIVKVHRVFSSYDKYSASARKFQFHWTYIGDSGEVVTPFMQVGNYPTRNFATLGPSRITAAVYKSFHSKLAPILLTYLHRAGVSPYTSSYDFAETCVFSKQSLPLILCHFKKISLIKTPFIPKLQGQFAEFLQYN